MNQIEQYVERILAESTPDKPLWNIEKIREGKINGWNYIDGCMMTALLNLYQITGQKRYFDFVENFLDYYVQEDGSLLGFAEDEYNLDNICEGRVLFDVYAATGKEKYRKAIDTLYGQILRQPRTAEGSFWHKKIYPNQVWLDGLYMAQVFYARYTSEFENCANYGDIRTQFSTVRQKMYDSATGLYRHGYDASKTAFWADQNGCSANPWLRSLGWFSAALIDVTAEIRPGHEAFRSDMVHIARELAENLKQYIDPQTGMLWQVPNRIGCEGNYPETSGSAMVAYFFLKGARLGILDADCAALGEAIFNSICERYLTQTDGKLNLGGICLVAGLGPENNRRRDGSYEYYISEPIVENDAKGLAPFLMCYTELLLSKKEEPIMSQNLFDLSGKVALVTGASYGIGFAIASSMAKAGATIVFNDIKQELVDKGLANYEEAGIKAHGYVCDVTDEAAVQALVEKVEAEVGVIDILVNNAGIIKRIPMLEMSAEQFRQVIDVDLNAPFIVSKAVIPSMIKKGGGKIINICSMMSELGRETVSAYAAAKGGLKMLTKNIASEYGQYNIQCNGIGPGYIATPQTAPLREVQPDGSKHPFDQFILAKTPANRWGEASDLSGPAVFLASAASDFVNGHILYVDGGILAYLGKQPS